MTHVMPIHNGRYYSCQWFETLYAKLGGLAAVSYCMKFVFSLVVTLARACRSCVFLISSRNVAWFRRPEW